MGFVQAVQNMLLLAIPAAVYGAVVRWRSGVTLAEIAKRLGLAVGDRRSYLLALAVTVPFVPLVIWVSQWTSTFKGSTIAPFVGAHPTPAILVGIASYGLLATGLPEELIFRGLIAGALLRRTSFWKANFIQAGIFVLPHLLILLVAPRLWPLAILLPLALGLVAGWLRHTSGSIGPSVILHSIPNMVGALAVLNWSR